MSQQTVQVTPIRLTPPQRIGQKPRAMGAPVIEALPVADPPAGYPYDMSVSPTSKVANGPGFDWHSGPGIVIDTYA
ncbi:MAG: hypothetical protein KKB20_14480 [Proteobacteria bacterium]|nr:hypothetical protein [Pseudomonadota bacterium]